MPRKRKSSFAAGPKAPYARLFRKYWGDEKRRTEQLQKVAAKQFQAQVRHWAATNEQTRAMIQAEAAQLRSRLTEPAQSQRESLVIDVIVNEWVRTCMCRHYMNLGCWTAKEFKYLQRRFVEAETAMKASLTMLRQLRGLEVTTSQAPG